MERRNFIKGCICAACLSALGCGMLSKKEIDNFDKNVNYNEPLRHIEVHLTEHCNLNCKYCSHFSPLAKEEFYDVEEFKRDMERLSYLTNGKIGGQIQLLGGEPLLHPEIEKFTTITRKYFPDSTIDIITNGALLKSMKSSFWKNLKENNINLLLSLYPIKIDWPDLFKKAKKYGVNLATETPTGNEKLNFENIKKYQIKNFYKVQLDSKMKQPMKRDCSANINCANYKSGKLYPCFLIANIKHFNSYFNKNFKVTKDDFIDLYKVNSLEEINKFLFSPHPFCKYCTPLDSKYVEWEVSKTHTIDEWMLP